jgi:hypothetical protein
MLKMRKILSVAAGCLLVFGAFAQVKVSEGPELNNEEDNKMNRMIQGEDGAFYAYRIRTKGKGTSYLIEKFSEASLKTVFSKEVQIPEEKTKVLDVRFAGSKVYVLYRTYDKEKEIMSLNYKTVSPEGVVSAGAELLQRKTDHYEYIDFDITNNTENTKLAVKTTYKANKEDQYKTDFVLFDAAAGKTVWTKTVNKYLKKSNPWFVWSFKAVETTGFLGFMLDANDDIYYAYNDKLKKDDKKDGRYNAAIEILRADSKTPQTVKLDLNPEYLVYDVKFSMNKQNHVVLAGFFKDVVERKGRDLVDVGVFNYRINHTTGTIEGKSVKIFDEKILTALESNQKRARNMIYKVDYVLPSGDDFYLVGEQYTVTVSDKGNSGGFGAVSNIIAIASGANPAYVGKLFTYEYMDVIVAKINAKGEFEWVANSPLRNGVTTSDNPHVFKQYIAYASTKGVFLFYNTHAKNAARLAKADFEPSDLKTSMYIHGTNFVYSKITADGKMKHDIAFKNETYCFAPIQERDIKFLPPDDAEIFVEGKTDELFIYLEDRGKGRFSRLILE